VSDHDADLAGSAEIYVKNFAATDAIRNVWEEAAAGRPSTPEGFASARRAFWSAVNSGESDDAQTVKRVLTDGGFVFDEERRPDSAPLLRISGWDPPEGALRSFNQDRWENVLELQARRNWTDDYTRRFYESAFSPTELRQREELKQQHPDWCEKDIEDYIGPTRREIAARSLSIDHINPKSDFREQTLDPGNLRFMMRDDNAARGNRFDGEDRLTGLPNSPSFVPHGAGPPLPPFDQSSGDPPPPSPLRGGFASGAPPASPIRPDVRTRLTQVKGDGSNATGLAAPGPAASLDIGTDTDPAVGVADAAANMSGETTEEIGLPPHELPGTEAAALLASLGGTFAPAVPPASPETGDAMSQFARHVFIGSNDDSVVGTSTWPETSAQEEPANDQVDDPEPGPLPDEALAEDRTDQDQPEEQPAEDLADEVQQPDLDEDGATEEQAESSEPDEAREDDQQDEESRDEEQQADQQEADRQTEAQMEQSRADDARAQERQDESQQQEAQQQSELQTEQQQESQQEELQQADQQQESQQEEEQQQETQQAELRQEDLQQADLQQETQLDQQQTDQQQEEQQQADQQEEQQQEEQQQDAAQQDLQEQEQQEDQQQDDLQSQEQDAEEQQQEQQQQEQQQQEQQQEEQQYEDSIAQQSEENEMEAESMTFE
jgi:hypothetical protein